MFVSYNNYAVLLDEKLERYDEAEEHHGSTGQSRTRRHWSSTLAMLKRV